jgi:hypothetical protein
VETIGPYQIRRTLARGGTGAVFEAQDPAGRSVALKAFTHPAAEKAVLRERLLADARAAAGLGHPNLAAVIDAGEHHGRPYVVAELVDGVDLARAIRSATPLPMEWTLDVLRQLALGLQAAHAQGLFHLDLKPTDVRVTGEGDVKIVDFGVAHLKAIEPSGAGGSLHGIHYRAPEQIEGRRADGRADIFSVGAIAYELATRQRAFAGDDATAVMLRITRGMADMEVVPRTVFSPGFEELLTRCLRHDPAERYASVGELHDDLVALVRDVAPRLRAASDPAPPEPEAPLEIRLDEEPSARPADPPPPADAASTSALWAEAEQLRQEGRLSSALDACRRVLEVDPAHAAARSALGALEAAIQDGEVEQLCGLALGYAADGELALARKIAEKIRTLAPADARGGRLDAYLEEESGRRAAVALVASARDQLGLGHLDEARALAEDALLADPRSVPAREIVDRLSAFGEKPPPGRAGL